LKRRQVLLWRTGLHTKTSKFEKGNFTTDYSFHGDEHFNPLLPERPHRDSPTATHAVFVMYAVEPYNRREIGEHPGNSEDTSKWHLSRARKFLQKALEQIKKNEHTHTI
jgi:hypothetical protein